jgi:hypothetical protein
MTSKYLKAEKEALKLGAIATGSEVDDIGNPYVSIFLNDERVEVGRFYHKWGVSLSTESSGLTWTLEEFESLRRKRLLPKEKVDDPRPNQTLA